MKKIKVKYSCIWDCGKPKIFTKKELFREYHEDSFGDDWELPNGRVGNLKDLLLIIQSDDKYIDKVFIEDNMSIKRIK